MVGGYTDPGRAGVNAESGVDAELLRELGACWLLAGLLVREECCVELG